MSRPILALGGHSIIYGLGSALGKFLSVMLLPIFTAYVPPQGYGVLAMVSILTMVAHPVFSLGIGAAMGPGYFAATEGARARTVWSAFAVHAASAAILLLLAWSIPAELARAVMLQADQANVVSLSLTGTALSVMTVALVQHIQFAQRAAIYVSANVVSTAAGLLTGAACVMWLQMGALGLVVAQVVTNALMLLACLVVCSRDIGLVFSRVATLSLLRGGLPLVPGFAFLFMLMHSNKYLLEMTAGLGQVGVFAVGFNLGTVLGVVTGGVATAWYPFFMSYASRRQEACTLFGRVFTVYVLGAGLLCLTFFIFAAPLAALMTKPEFHASARVIGFIAAANFMIGVYSLALPPIYYAGEISVQSLLQAGAVVIAVPLNWLLIENFGITGAAAGVFVGHLLLAAAAFGWSAFRGEEYFRVAYEWSRIRKISLVYAGIAAATFLVPLDQRPTRALLDSFILLAVAVAATVLLLTRAERTSFFGLVFGRFRASRG